VTENLLGGKERRNSKIDEHGECVKEVDKIVPDVWPCHGTLRTTYMPGEWRRNAADVSSPARVTPQLHQSRNRLHYI